MECKNCHKEITNEEYKVCPYCGNSLDSNKVCINNHTTQIVIKEDAGSFGAGFCLGFFLGIIGVVIAAAINKKETLRGSLYGFLIPLIIGAVIGFLILIIMFAIYR